MILSKLSVNWFASHLGIAFLSGAALVAGPISAVDCNASATQVQTTIDDSLKVAACVLSDVLGGQTDPLRIAGDCYSAVPSLIVQIIDDFLAQKALPDAGFAAVAPSLTPEQRGFLQDARTKAASALAAKATSK